jgi:DNA-binding LacI/PurR family transcriptional regulator
MPQPFALLNFRPVRISDQAAAALSDGIRRGTLRNYLPGEHELARQLGISRPTVHAAILTLKKNGLLETRQGSRTRILARATRSDVSPRVCVITPVSHDAVGLVENPFLLALRIQMSAQGIRWEEIFDSRLGGENPDRHLEKLIGDREGICWLIVAGSAAVQRWFERQGLPTLVLGSCHPGISLPSVDRDYHALGWHIAGNMVRFGHRHIALIFRERPLPGDLACRDAVASYLKNRCDHHSLTVATVGKSTQELQSKLDRMLERQPRPTVIFANAAEHVQTVLMHLQRSGWIIPKDISVVSGDAHALFEANVPELTCYRDATERAIRHTIRMVNSLLAGRPVPPKPFLSTPTFVAGNTLSHATESR